MSGPYFNVIPDGNGGWKAVSTAPSLSSADKAQRDMLRKYMQAFNRHVKENKPKQALKQTPEQPETKDQATIDSKQELENDEASESQAQTTNIQSGSFTTGLAEARTFLRYQFSKKLKKDSPVDEQESGGVSVEESPPTENKKPSIAKALFVMSKAQKEATQRRLRALKR